MSLGHHALINRNGAGSTPDDPEGSPGAAAPHPEMRLPGGQAPLRIHRGEEQLCSTVRTPCAWDCWPGGAEGGQAAFVDTGGHGPTF